MNLSYNGNDGYDEPEYPGNGVSIAGKLNATDADFHSEDVSALVHAARILRGQNSS